MLNLLDWARHRTSSEFIVRYSPNSSKNNNISAVPTTAITIMSKSGSSTFVKRGTTRFPSIPGTRPSVHNTSQLLTPSGVPDLDAILGGGIPVGSVVLVKDDHKGDNLEALGECEPTPLHSRLFLKYFLAEGVAQGQGLFYGSCHHDAEGFLASLPEVVEQQETAGVPEKGADDKLTIAWRYRDSNQSSSGPENSAKHHFNLQKNVSEERLAACDSHTWTCVDAADNQYVHLFKNVKRVIEEQEEYSIAPPKSSASKKGLLRIGVESAGSLLWGTDPECTELFRFLFALRSLCRTRCISAFLDHESLTGHSLYSLPLLSHHSLTLQIHPLSLATCFVILDDLPELCSSIRRRLFEAADFVLCVQSFRQRERTGIFKVII